MLHPPEEIKKFRFIEEFFVVNGLYFMFITTDHGKADMEDCNMLDDILSQGGYTEEQGKKLAKIIENNDTKRLQSSIGKFVMDYYKAKDEKMKEAETLKTGE